MQLPPTNEVIQVILQDVLPAAGSAALIDCLFLSVNRRAGALGSALAVTIAFIVASFSLENSLDDDGVRDWMRASRLFPWKAEPSPRIEWLPRAALLLVVVGLVSRWAGLLVSRVLPPERWWGANLLVWLPRLTAVIVVSGWLVSERIDNESPWLRYTILLVMLVNWIILDGLARAREGCEVAGLLTLIFFSASAVLIYAQSTKYMELAVVIGAAMFGITVAANLLKADVSGAVPAGVAFLPGLVLGGKPTFVSEVPSECFWLVSLSPLILAPFLVPFLSRRVGWFFSVLRTLLILIPLAIAVFLAMKYEDLPLTQ